MPGVEDVHMNVPVPLSEEGDARTGTVKSVLVAMLMISFGCNGRLKSRKEDGM